MTDEQLKEVISELINEEFDRHPGWRGQGTFNLDPEFVAEAHRDSIKFIYDLVIDADANKVMWQMYDTRGKAAIKPLIKKMMDEFWKPRLFNN